MNKEATIRSIKNQDERVVQSVYQQFKPKFENWLKGRYKIVRQEDCSEIYQRSFTVLFFNIKKGKLNDLESSLETYLFGIGKLIIKEWWREKSVEKEGMGLETQENLNEVDLFSTLFNGNTIEHNLREKLALTLNNLGEPCKTILTLFYWERNSMEAIANKTGYKNEQGAKKKKYLCLSKLKELMNQ